MRHVLFNPALKQQQSRNADQQNADRRRDEGIDAGAVDSAQMAQQAHPQNRPGTLPVASATTTFCAPFLCADEPSWNRFW